jgi:hypothetical protein
VEVGSVLVALSLFILLQDLAQRRCWYLQFPFTPVLVTCVLFIQGLSMLVINKLCPRSTLPILVYSSETFSLDPRLLDGPVSLPYNSTPLPLTPILFSGECQHRDAALAYNSTRRHAAEDHNPVLDAVFGVLVWFATSRPNITNEF